MTIELPESVVAMAEAKAKVAGYARVAEYVARLVATDEPRPRSIPNSFTTREELEKLLDEGMEEQESVQADDAFWAERTRVLEERRAARARGER